MFGPEQLAALNESARLKTELYSTLVEKYDFERVSDSKFPGTVDGVVNDLGIEITGVPVVKGLRININLPVEARRDATFTLFSCGDKEYLANRESIFANRYTLGDCVTKAVEIAKLGRYIVACNPEGHI